MVKETLHNFVWLTLLVLLPSTFGQPNDYDVIVIGSGLAGTSAAMEAASLGAKVLLLDKDARGGGNSAKATSGMNGAGTTLQGEQSITDMSDIFGKDTMASKGLPDADADSLVRLLTHSSADAVEWVASWGVKFAKIAQLGGHSSPRTHRIAKGPVGFTIIKTLRTAAEEKFGEQITFTTNAKVTGLNTVHGRNPRPVRGLTYIQTDEEGNTETVQVTGQAVVLATGGYAQNNDLLDEFASYASGLASTNGPWATGDGLQLGQDAGAATVDMGFVQIHPTGFVDPSNPESLTKFLAPEALRGSGGILLTSNGERFANELGLRDYLTNAIRDKSGGWAWLVMDTQAKDEFGPNFGFYWRAKKFFTEYGDVESMAADKAMDPIATRRSLEEYVRQECPFGKSTFPSKVSPDGKLYAAKIQPVLHYTMGGLRINTNAQVLTQDGDVIPGLYAAGEVTGGVHGKNRLGGNSLLECVVYGRVAGKNAAGETRTHEEL